MGEPLSVSSDVIETALLVGVQRRGQDEWSTRDSLDELKQLAETAGASVSSSYVVKMQKLNPGTYIGKGKAHELAEHVKDNGVTLVLFDDDLTPAQARNLEGILEVRVLDRTQLILDIFAQHAHTREGTLQVELAQLEYLIPRLRHMWTHLERQQGGIGLRGPGEKQLEMDRRRIQDQIGRLRRELESVRSRRAEQRRGRRRHGWALLTLVGYTNAGKSTLLNSLTGADIPAYDQLFATLDPTTRKLELPNKQMALMTDTVGFIKKLPHHVVESFKATLEEVNEADLLVHVIDASHPQVDQQVDAVNEVLKELGAEQTPVVHVLNKMDRDSARANATRLEKRLDKVVSLSAKTGEGLDPLCHFLADQLKARHATVRLRVPLAEGKLLADIRRTGRILEERYEDSSVLLEASLPPDLLGRCASYRTTSS